MYVRSWARGMREMRGREDMHVCDQRREACIEVELGIELVTIQGIDDES